MKAIPVALALLLCSCVPGPFAPRPATAESIALQAGDIPGLKSCPQTGTIASYMAKEKSSDPTSYSNDLSGWDDLRVFGATDGYNSVFATNAFDCAFFSEVAAPKGRLVYVFVTKFKAAVNAEVVYGLNIKDYTVAGKFTSTLDAEGGTLSEGAVTGLGDVSLIATVTVAATLYYVAYWQNKTFDVTLYGLNLSAFEGTTAAHRINGRIH